MLCRAGGSRIGPGMARSGIPAGCARRGQMASLRRHGGGRSLDWPVSSADAEWRNCSSAGLDKGLYASILPGLGSPHAKVFFVSSAEASLARDPLPARRRFAGPFTRAAPEYRAWRVLPSQCSVPRGARLPGRLGIGCESRRGNRYCRPDGGLVGANDAQLHSRLSTGAMARRGSSRFLQSVPRRAPLPVLSLDGRSRRLAPVSRAARLSSPAPAAGPQTWSALEWDG